MAQMAQRRDVPRLISTSRDLGRRLHMLRFDKGWSIRHLSLVTGITKSQLSRFERGAMWPGVDDLLVLCDVFDITPDELLRFSASRVKPNTAYPKARVLLRRNTRPTNRPN